MTTGSAITVIVTSFMMAMVVELMMPLLLAMHLFSSLATWVRHLLLPPTTDKGEPSSFLEAEIVASKFLFSKKQCESGKHKVNGDEEEIERSQCEFFQELQV